MGLKYKVAESKLIKKNVFQILEPTLKTGKDKWIDLRRLSVVFPSTLTVS